MLNLKSFDPRELYVFIVEEPLLAHLFMRSKIKEDASFPALAGVCIKKGMIHLFLNPEKMSLLAPNEKIGVLVHEYLHILLLHCSGRFSDVNDTTNQAKKIKENIAMDMAINQLIMKSFDLPNNCVLHNKEPFDFPPDLTAEQYYELIEKQHSDEEIENRFGNWEFDDHSQWGSENQLEGRSVVKELAKSYAQTKQGGDMGRTLKGAGNKYGNILETLMAIETYDINWQVQAKRFIQNLLDDKRRFTYKRFSRRYGFPSPGQKFKTKAKVAAIVDTSGSMSASYLSHIGGQLNLMCKIMQVDVLWCDADVQGSVKKYRPTKELEIPGRGGTDMQPAFDLALNEKYRGVICFTDGYLYTETLSKLPTLWVIVNNQGFKEPFGSVVHVDWQE